MTSTAAKRLPGRGTPLAQHLQDDGLLGILSFGVDFPACDVGQQNRYKGGPRMLRLQPLDKLGLDFKSSREESFVSL